MPPPSSARLCVDRGCPMGSLVPWAPKGERPRPLCVVLRPPLTAPVQPMGAGGCDVAPGMCCGTLAGGGRFADPTCCGSLAADDLPIRNPAGLNRQI